MKILLCASEGAPFAKTGGLADVIGALPKALLENRQDIRVVLPFYKRIKSQNIAYYQGYAYVKIAQRMEYAGIFHSLVDGINFYFIDNERYFNRDGLYGYDDDGERFAFYNFAVLEMLKVVNFFPDVIHCNDWQTGLIPYILKQNYHYYDEYRNMKTVYSIHNIQYQGNFPLQIMDILFMPYSSSLEFDDNLNFMKAGICEADVITTVSDTYKYETLTDFFGYRLNNVLGSRYYDYYGLLNGIDTSVFNPATDKYIHKNYDLKSYKINKKACKKALMMEMNFDTTDVPLFGLVSRLVEQKGLDILKPIMDDVISYSNAKFIFMGNGDQEYENYFRYLEGKYPERFKCYIGYNEAFAQKIYAGCDIFLMPSKFEPCGLGQMIAMRYGTLPLVRETGGLKDSVIPFNKYEGTGTGFSFSNYDAFDLKNVMFLAMETYNSKDIWNKLIENAMNADFSWENSSKRYIELYKKITGLEE